MNESDFPSGEPFPLETRIEPHEFSYDDKFVCTWEFIDRPLPFENRVIALPFYVKPTSKRMTNVEIAKKLKISEGRVDHIAQEIGAPITSYEENEIIRYDVHTFEVIEEYVEWQASYDELAESLSSFQIGEFLGMNWTLVVRYANDLGIYPRKEMFNGREYLFYPKSLAKTLHTLQLQAPPANDAYTITELEDITGKSHKWIKRIVDENDIQLVTRTNLISHEITKHYPEQVIPILEEEKNALPPPAGAWLTEHAMAHLLGRSDNWMTPRLARYTTLAEERLTVQSRVALHYPPEVFEEIRSENKEVEEDTTGWYSAFELSQLAGRSIFWTRARLKRYDSTVKQFPSKYSTKPLTKHYPENVKEEIISLAQKEPPEAEGRLTVEEMSRMLNRRRNWVILRIAQLSIESDMRLDRRMKPRQHYDPETVDALQLHFLIDEENAEN